MACRWLSSKPWDTHPAQDRRLSFVKVVVWDGTGVWLCQRRLHKGRFIWPTVSDACFLVTFEQWHWLITGVDWQRLSAVPAANWQV
jgi:transposase